MKQLLIGVAFFVLTFHSVAQVDTPREYFLLETYFCSNDAQVALVEDYIAAVKIPWLHQHQVKNIGVFKQVGMDTMAIKKIVVFIPVQTLDRWQSLEMAAESINPFQPTVNVFENASYDQPAFDRIESVILKAFPTMPEWRKPALQGKFEDRIYELRSYESASELLYRRKVHMFNDGGEIQLFDRLRFNATFYGQVMAGSRKPNLMYMTCFNNMTDRNEHWKNFVDSPEWKKLIADERYDHTVSKIDITFLRPTNYSEW